MAKRAYRKVVQMGIVSGWLMFMTGCALATNPASPVAMSAPLTDLDLFIRQLAREALAAFLF